MGDILMDENLNVDILEEKSKKNAESIYDIASIVVSAVIAVGIIFTFLFKISTVSGESMENTLHHADRLIICSIVNDVEYGDVVVTSQPNLFNKVLIKRVIAVGGQTVWFDEETKQTIVDGKALDEPYIKEEMEYTEAMDKLFTVPEGYVFVMGDNRNNSSDSRDEFVGVIDENYIVGKVVYRFGDKSLFNSYFKES
jgi:signal peptidase I